MDELIIGTYEGFLLGYSIRHEDNVIRLKQTFATHSHTASVRCVSIAGKFLASGGSDDKIVVIDLKTRKEHTVLMNHDGSVNTVAFTHNGTHLLSGSDDGSIIVTRTGNWKIEKIWKKAHGGQSVTSVIVHPTDKLALSLGGDKTLRTWNLIKGRPAFTINLASKQITMPINLTFSPGGDRFSLISDQTVDVWTLSKAGVDKRITCNSKPMSVQWLDDDNLYVGLDNGNIISFAMSDAKANTHRAHKQRVKCLHYENDILYSASSSGEIKVWSMEDSLLKEICSNNASCRVTCVTLNRQNHLIKIEGSEDKVTLEKNSETNIKPIEEENSEDSDTNTKRKPGPFISISYGDEDDVNNHNSMPPSIKKLKKNKSKSKNNK